MTTYGESTQMPTHIGRAGGLMGAITVLKDQTLMQLNDEARLRWPGCWDPGVQRVQVLVLCKRRERVILEQHGATINHSQPVFGLFHRPRHSLHLFEEQGFNHREASFQFLDVATSELGVWMQHLITNDGWKRSSTVIAPLPIDADVPMQRRFENHTILTFRHPELPELKSLHLPMPLTSMVGKAFVSYPPGTEAQEEEPVPKVERTPVARMEEPAIPRPSTSQEGDSEDLQTIIDEVEEETEHAAVSELVDGFSAELLASVTHSGSEEFSGEPEAPQPEPVEETVEEPESEVVPEVVPEVVEEDATSEEEATSTPEVQSAPTPSNDDSRSAPVPSDGGVVDEFRRVVKELLAEGMEAADMMGDPRFAEANEFCAAAGVDTWSLFMQMTGN